MAGNAYPALFHNIHKQMADVSFPISKRDLLEKISGRNVFTEWDRKVPLKSFIEPIPRETFSCAADFYCGMIAAM